MKTNSIFGKCKTISIFWKWKRTPTFWKMEDDLNLFGKWKMTSFFWEMEKDFDLQKMEDGLNIYQKITYISFDMEYYINFLINEPSNYFQLQLAQAGPEFGTAQTQLVLRFCCLSVLLLPPFRHFQLRQQLKKCICHFVCSSICLLVHFLIWLSRVPRLVPKVWPLGLSPRLGPMFSSKGGLDPKFGFQV